MENRRDPSAHGDFVDRVHAHQGIVRKVSAVYAAGRDEREDLSQEILMQLWRAYPSFRGESSFATWMYRVALNTALLARRRRGRGPARVEADPGAAADVPVDDPDEVAADEEVRLLYACIRELPELDRAIVLLHLEGQPHAAIAAVTGLETGNVAVRLHRAKRRLGERLRARGVRP